MMPGKRSTGGGTGAARLPATTSTTAAPRGPIDARHGARLRLAVWVGTLTVGMVVFHALGGGALSPPPLDPSGWGAWAAGRDPLPATFAVLRLLVLALGWYLLGATAVGILARVPRRTGLLRIADALTLPALRRLLHGALGVSLATAMATSVPAWDPGTTRPAPVTLRAAGPEVTEPGELMVVLAALDDDRVTLEHVDGSRPLPLRLLDRAREAQTGPAAGAGGGEVDERPSAADTAAADADDEVTADEVAADEVAADEVAADEAAAPADDATGPVAGVHVVVPGESFWTIAQDALGSGLGRPPTEAESLVYWRRLIEANRDRLVDRDNADLIFPGQELVVPSGAVMIPRGRG
jgi:hypothetical protein